jgi:two-component system, OmpR family, osmolarity sensor histidine kinase EnvZ
VSSAGGGGRPFGLKRFLPRTLLGRTTLIIVTPVVLAQLVATWIFYERHWDTVTRRLAFAVAGDIAMIVELLDKAATLEDEKDVLTLAARTTDLMMTVEPGADLPQPIPPPRGRLAEAIAKAMRERVGLPFSVNTQMEDWYEIRVDLPLGVLSVLSPEKRLFSPTTYIFILWMVGSALVLFAIAMIFMRNQIRPIRRLAAAADAFGKGRDAPNFKPEGAAEVRQAALAFLAMRERIQRQIGQRTEMLAGVSHDLRTPLTRMKLALDMLEPSPEVEELGADVAEMEVMIEAYLAFARGEGEEAVSPVDLDRVLREAAAAVRRQGALIDYDGPGALTLPLRPNAVRRCFVNLLVNAHRHADAVRIGIDAQPHFVDVTVDDDGPGIPPHLREDAFRPFQRLDPARESEGGGSSGLGLTIARDVARSHGGDITLEDSPHGGLRVRVRLPR